MDVRVAKLYIYVYRRANDVLARAARFSQGVPIMPFDSSILLNMLCGSWQERAGDQRAGEEGAVWRDRWSEPRSSNYEGSGKASYIFGTGIELKFWKVHNLSAHQVIIVGSPITAPNDGERHGIFTVKTGTTHPRTRWYNAYFNM